MMTDFDRRPSFIESFTDSEDSVDERELTQRALRKASDSLVDMTVPTPWERSRADEPPVEIAEHKILHIYALIANLSDEEKKALEELVPQPDDIALAERIYQMSASDQDELFDAIGGHDA